MTISYNSNIPSANNDPSDDQPLMQQNTNNIASYVAVDHIGFGIANSGYHNVIHEVPQVSNPAAIPGINQIFAKTVTINAIADTQLFSMTGLGIVSQLTGGKLATPGYQYLGGILLQWGSATIATSGSATTITFPIAFPSTVFTVTFGTEYTTNTNSPSANPIFIKNGTITTTQFQMVNSSSGTPAKVYYLAIGN